MWPTDRLQKLFGIEHPVIQAPMAGASTPAMAIAVANAGGMGSLGCAMLTADQLRGAASEVAAGSNRAVNFNFFVHVEPDLSRHDPAPMRAALAPYYAEAGLGDPSAPTPGAPAFNDEMLEVLLACAPKVASFHFGLPSAHAVEALTRIGRMPGPGDRCLDLGACPGGWTWVLAKLGAEVTAVDKAPLDPAVAAMPGVTVRAESAFGLDPKSEPPVDWLFSDVICYPARLLGLVRRWIEADAARSFVCTLKFQGETDHDTAEAFAALPGAQLFHSAQNKHELTFALLR